MTALSWADAGVLVLSLIIARLLGDWVIGLIRGREKAARPPADPTPWREGQADALTELADQPPARELQLGFQRLSIDYDEEDRRRRQ